MVFTAFDLPRQNLSADQACIPGFGIALGAALVPLAIVSFIVPWAAESPTMDLDCHPSLVNY
jgi:hypothetical protein